MPARKSTSAAAPAQPLVDRYRPRVLADVRGQDQVVLPLRQILKSPMSCALIFEGGTGTGKTSAAIAFARELGVEVDQPQLGGLYQIPSGEQTGETVRELVRSLSLCPMMGSGWKVVIVNEADYMSQSAAQIWLDVLENLPRKSIVIFTTNHVRKLPTRFRDRCVTLHFESSYFLLRPQLESFLAHVWKAETGRSDAPRLQDLDLVDEEGATSFRRLLQALQPHVLAGTKPTPKPQRRALPTCAKGEPDWDHVAAAFRSGRTFVDIAREIGASWQRIMCGLKKRGVC